MECAVKVSREVQTMEYGWAVSVPACCIIQPALLCQIRPDAMDRVALAAQLGK